MLSFQVKQDSEALKILDKLMNMDTKPVMQNISEVGEDSLRQHVFQQYRNAWGGNPKLEQAKNVYEAVKLAVFGDNARRGILTGSTATSIRSSFDNYFAQAGIFGGSWPTNTGSESASMSDALGYLEEAWMYGKKRGAMGIQDKASYRYKTIRESRYLNIQGEVTMKWNQSGLKITWPETAKKIFRLKDMSISSEPFNTKKYGRNKSKVLFYMTPQIVRDSFSAVEVFIDNLLAGVVKKTSGYRESPSISQDVQDLFNEFPDRYESPGGY